MPFLLKKPAAPVLAPKPPAPVVKPPAAVVKPLPMHLSPTLAKKPLAAPVKAPVVATVAAPKATLKPAAKPAQDLGVMAQPEEEIDKMSLEQLTDLYGTLNDQADAIMLNPIFANLKLVEEELKHRLEDFDSNSAVTVKGEHWLLEAGPCSKAPRAVENLWVFRELVGNDTFMKLVKVNYTDAVKYLTPEQLAKVTGPEKQTLNRKKSVSFLG